MGISGMTAAYAMMAAAAGAAVASATASKGQSPQIATPPQAAKTPDVAGTRQALAGAGQGGGAPGVSQTFLSGVQGVDPSLLQLGRSTLLGGGTSTPSGASVTGG